MYDVAGKVRDSDLISREGYAVTRPLAVQVGWVGVVAAVVVWAATAFDARAAEEKKAAPKPAEAKGFFGSGAEGVNTTSGRVASTTAQSIEVRAQGRNLTFYAKKADKGMVALIAQLAPPDSVTITWTQKDGRKWVQKIEGRDTVEGFVTGKSNLGIEVTPKDGIPQRALFPWTGKTAEEIANLDEKQMKRMRTAKPGDEVRLTWEISDAKRVTEMKVLTRAPAQRPSGGVGQGTPHHSPSANSVLRRARRMGGPANGASPGGAQKAGAGGGGFAP